MSTPLPEQVRTHWKQGFDTFLESSQDCDVTLGSSRLGHYASVGKAAPWMLGKYNVVIRDVWMEESLRGQGIFTDFLGHVESHPDVVEVAVANIKNHRLNPFLAGRGYDDDVSHCFLYLHQNYPGGKPPGSGPLGRYLLAVSVRNANTYNLPKEESVRRTEFCSRVGERYPGVQIEFVAAEPTKASTDRVRVSRDVGRLEGLFGPLGGVWPFGRMDKAVRGLTADAERWAKELAVA